MSKRVKRVMRVLMVSLVAMLGAKAEAHYFWFFGKIKFCSVCLDPGTDDNGNPVPTLTEVPADPAHPDHPPAPAVVELSVKTKLVEISCPTGTARLKKPVTLSGQTLSNVWGWDPALYDPTTETVPAYVSVKVDDRPLKEMFCPGSDPANVKVLILKMSATAKVYECGSDPTCSSSKVLVTVVRFTNCALDVATTDYDCNAPDIQHRL